MLQLDHNLAIAAAIVIPGAIQFTIGNVIEPKLMGDGLDLHPLSILLALIFWGMIWGPVGMLMAAPMTAIMRIILARFETTGPAAELLAGRLPVSSSNDEIAAQDHAEAS
jgi:AI-2 transport protein TqsA